MPLLFTPSFRGVHRVAADADGRSVREILRNDAESRQGFGKRSKIGGGGGGGDDLVPIAVKWLPKVTPDSMLNRYYRRLYIPSIHGNVGWDQYVHIHSNRVCMVGITASHPAVASGVAIASVAFAVGKEKVAEVKVWLMHACLWRRGVCDCTNLWVCC